MSAIEINHSAELAWDYVWNKIFCEKTNMFYDFRVSDDPDGNISHLPHPDLIKKQIPNPCGWGTGMEDSSLNGGMMLDIVLNRYAVTKDEGMCEYASKIFEGLKLCAMVAERKGFLARSVSPIDCVSHYTNSSRDQYTHWVYSVYRFYYSDLCSREQKNDIKDILISFAKRQEEDVTAENDWNILRDDGKIGLCMKMWGELGAHEYLRMPMIYAAAWDISKDEHWKQLYLKYRDKAMAKTLEIDLKKYYTPYPILQMQYSLKLLYLIDSDQSFRKKCVSLMAKTEEYFARIAVESSNDFCSKASKDAFSYRYLPWTKAKAAYLGIIGDVVYYNPDQGCLKENQSNWYVRCVGDGGALASLRGKYDDKLFGAVVQMLEAIDYETHYSATPINLINAYWLLKQNCELQ